MSKFDVKTAREVADDFNQANTEVRDWVQDALAAPLPQRDHELRGAGVVIGVCLFGLVFGLAVPFFVWLYCR